MANSSRFQPRVSRETTSGTLPGRLRGGFTASSIPRSVSSGSPTPTLSSAGDSTERTDGRSPLPDINAGGDLFAQLSSMACSMKCLHEAVKRIDRRIGSVEESVKELTTLMKKQDRDNFTIKGSIWEVPLREEAARLFCLSLTRQPDDTDIHEVICKVLGRLNVKERYKVQVALKYVRAKLTEYRSEERRKVLGHAPYTASCHMNTRDLGAQILRQIHAPEDINEEIYFRHLAIFRQFARLSADDKTMTYNIFRRWLVQGLGSATISEEAWEEIMKEDEVFDYPNLGVGRPQMQVANEQEVEIENDEDFNEAGSDDNV